MGHEDESCSLKMEIQHPVPMDMPDRPIAFSCLRNILHAEGHMQRTANTTVQRQPLVDIPASSVRRLVLRRPQLFSHVKRGCPDERVSLSASRGLLAVQRNGDVAQRPRARRVQCERFLDDWVSAVGDSLATHHLVVVRRDAVGVAVARYILVWRAYTRAWRDTWTHPDDLSLIHPAYHNIDATPDCQ